MILQIDMLNVGEADAIVIYVEKNSVKHLILVDSGNTGDFDKIIRHINYVMNEKKHNQIDLMILTHSDADHIGSMKSIVHYYNSRIKKVWLHDFKSHLKESDVRNFRYGAAHNDKYAKLMLESLQQSVSLKNTLVELNINYREPFSSLTYDSFLKVIAPHEEYYKSLVLKFNKIGNWLNEADNSDYIIGENIRERFADYNPCQLLDDIGKKTTPENNSSVIFEIKANFGKYLFTGDVGIEAFDNIPDNYKQNIQNIYWLKVPHHGSKNNLNSELISTMQPKKAFISADRKKHPDKVVVECLKRKGCDVYVTGNECNFIRIIDVDEFTEPNIEIL